MFLVDSGKFANDPDGVMTHVRELLTKTGATIRSDRVWLDGKLAYPIDGRRRGVHFLVYFQGDGNANTEISRQVRLSDLVLRHIVIRHPEIMWDRLVAAISTGEETAEETA
ncbi:MAG TPA: 30S ribosomal protein S6, partial [Planctomycetaceae bacterium]|nr:30S ribosomal protein S6 [Planctomycetaceae bacterium]